MAGSVLRTYQEEFLLIFDRILRCCVLLQKEDFCLNIQYYSLLFRYCIRTFKTVKKL